MAVVPRPLAGGKAIILGRVFNDGRNFYIFNYATSSLQTQISLLQVEVFYNFKLRAETHVRLVSVKAVPMAASSRGDTISRMIVPIVWDRSINYQRGVR